ncbi:hypothetical protein [Actinomadura sp. WMMA1423]|uniref:hypothetical protein n=1 Tax=Actinomadura sp. WMMA1423 TaxID=2591108 RepID=UPI0011462639|nr:hypothetical protein [Actinomadura sp. WMMA1423]
MSGPRDAREHGEQGGDAAPLKLPAFGLEAPWWAAESADAAPPAEQAPAAPEPLSAPVVEDEADALAPEVAPVPEAAPAPSPPPGTLVAGTGVPRVDSRGAVPAEPIVKPPLSTDDTDPEGFRPVPPAFGASRDEAATDASAPRSGAPRAGVRQEEAPRAEAAAAAPETRAAMPGTPVGDNAADPSTAHDTAGAGTAVDDTVTDMPTPLSAFERAKEAEDAASLAPVLVPDAILPPGFVPPTGSGPFPHGEPVEGGTSEAGQPQVGAPGHDTEAANPAANPAAAPPPGSPPPGMPAGGRGGSKGRPVLIGGVAAVILAAVGGLFLVGGSGSDGKDGKSGKSAEAPAAVQSTAPATPPATPPAKPSAPATGAVDITNEKTDTADLAFHDVFPTQQIRFGDRTYLRDRWSLNRDVTYAARGSMLAALRQQQCRKIVRATYIDPETKLAVTSGLAVMPTKAAATAVSKAGDPARYEWFRGMAGKRSPDIDQAGGYAASTVRGRYVAYAYVQWANGKKAKPGDPVIKKAAQLFLDYDLRPIVARARG